MTRRIDTYCFSEHTASQQIGLKSLEDVLRGVDKVTRGNQVLPLINAGLYAVTVWIAIWIWGAQAGTSAAVTLGFIFLLASQGARAASTEKALHTMNDLLVETLEYQIVLADEISDAVCTSIERIPERQDRHNRGLD